MRVVRFIAYINIYIYKEREREREIMFPFSFDSLIRNSDRFVSINNLRNFNDLVLFILS